MREGDAVEADARLQRAEAIIDELLATLDLEQGGDIASGSRASTSSAAAS